MKLGDDETRQVLVRASEIEQSAAASQADVQILMDEAAEVGIPRAAMERALRERMLLPMKPPTVGQLTFARSADNKYYVAEVVRASDHSPEGWRFTKGAPWRSPRGCRGCRCRDRIRPDFPTGELTGSERRAR